MQTYQSSIINAQTFKRDKDNIIPEALLFIRNIPKDASPSSIKEIFENYGKILSIKLKTGEKSTSATVQFSTPEEASYAIRGLNQTEFLGSIIGVALFSTIKQRLAETAMPASIFIESLPEIVLL